MRVLLSVLAAFALLLTATTVRLEAKDSLAIGEDVFRISAPRGEVPIYTYRPKNFGPSSPIWIVMHGVGRSAPGYFDVWQPLAEEAGALLLVPEFSGEDWPGSFRYALGNFTTSKGAMLPRRDWSFTVVQSAFQRAVALTGSRETGFYIYGHSAGGQFVHRYMIQTGGEMVKLAITANSGWYLVPSDEQDYPYGLRNGPVDRGSVRKSFSKPMVVLLGLEDTQRTGSLRQNEEADAQGQHRLARGHHFHQRSAAAAARRGVPYRWKVIEVPDAGHRNDEMAPAAARLFREARQN